jgi:carbonic anhydrase
MKKAYLTIAVAFLMCVIVPALSVSQSDQVLAASTAPATYVPAAGEADALLLSCMDYRLVHHVADVMQNHYHMEGKYDYVILAGASLGATNKMFPAWGTTFWEHLKTAIALHSIHEVIIMDHRNCGAYKVILKKDFPEKPTPAQLKEETAVHKTQLDALARAVHKKYPKLEVETLLMNLDGSVEKIGDIKRRQSLTFVRALVGWIPIQSNLFDRDSYGVRRRGMSDHVNVIVPGFRDFATPAIALVRRFAKSDLRGVEKVW